MIDTISYAEHLQREGDFTPKQAKLLALQRHEIEESMMTKADLANLATKHDLIELRADFKVLESSTQASLRELELRLSHNLTLKLGAIVVTTATVALAVARLIF